MRRIALHCAPLLPTLLAIPTTPALAEKADLVAPAPEPSMHLAVGPTMAISRLDNSWDSQVGGELHLARIAGGHPLAAVGGALGIASFAEGEATRLYLDFYVGLGVTQNWTVGIAAAPVLDVFASHRPRAGARVSAWMHSGIAPYVSASRMWGLGASGTVDVSAGLRIPFSVARF